MSKRQERIRAAAERYDAKPFYTCRSIFGYNDTFFWLFIGGRDIGKSYTIMDRFLRDFKTKGIPFYWIRLTDALAKAMLQSNARKFVDADLVRKYDLQLTVEGNEVFDHGVKMAEIVALSTFYNSKGTATFDCEWKKGYNICLDECQRERGEPVRFDLGYALVNQLENYVRDTKEKLRIVFICNDTEKVISDITNLFNFTPPKGKWGVYHIARKKAVMAYIPNNKAYMERRKGTVADLLMPEASTFSNGANDETDYTLVYKGRLSKLNAIIHFGDERFTLWDGEVIAPYKNQKAPLTIAMKPYIDGTTFNTKNPKTVQARYDNRGFKYRDLITQQRFTLALAKLKKTR